MTELETIEAAVVEGYGQYGTFDVEDAVRWGTLTPVVGDVLETGIPQEIVGEEGVVGIFLVTGFELGADGGMLVRVKSVGASSPAVLGILSSLFNRKEGKLHLCPGAGSCYEEGGVFHVRRVEVWKGSEFPSQRLSPGGKRLVKQMERGEELDLEQEEEVAPAGRPPALKGRRSVQGAGEEARGKGVGEKVRGRGLVRKTNRPAARLPGDSGPAALRARQATGQGGWCSWATRWGRTGVRGRWKCIPCSGRVDDFDEIEAGGQGCWSAPCSPDLWSEGTGGAKRRYYDGLETTTQGEGSCYHPGTSGSQGIRGGSWKEKEEGQKDQGRQGSEGNPGGSRERGRKEAKKTRMAQEILQTRMAPLQVKQLRQRRFAPPPQEEKRETGGLSARSPGGAGGGPPQRIEWCRRTSKCSPERNKAGDLLASPHPVGNDIATRPGRSRVILISKRPRPASHWPPWQGRRRTRGPLPCHRASVPGPAMVGCSASRAVFPGPHLSGRTSHYLGGEEIQQDDGEGKQARGRPREKQEGERRKRGFGLAEFRALVEPPKRRRKREEQGEGEGRALERPRRMEEESVAKGLEQRQEQGQSGEGGRSREVVQKETGPPGLKWWQSLVELAGDLSELGTGLYFSLFERGEAMDDDLLSQLSAEMALKKESQHPRVKHSKNQLFPLPRFWTVDFACFRPQAQVSEVLADKTFVKACAVECWCCLCTLFCNNLANEGFLFGATEASAPQRDLLFAIRQSVERVLGDDERAVWGLKEVLQDFERKSIGYSGEEICKAEPLSLERMLPGLPPEGHGGSINTIDWVSGHTRYLLLNPDKCVAMDVGQTLPKLQGKVHIKEGERLPIARELVRRGICRWIPESKVATFRGQKVLSGLFGVAKPKKLPSGECVLRLIMNLVPANAVLRTIAGKVEKLPSITQWLNVVIEEGETLRIAQSDMACAFYLFSLPEAWSSLLSFNLHFPSSVIGDPSLLSEKEELFLACRVLPMGWSSAVGVMQAIAESVLIEGGFNPLAQITKTSPLPPWVLQSAAAGSHQGKPWWHVYLDNFAAGSKVQDDNPEELILLQQQAEGLWKDAGIVVSEGKSVVAATSGVELGAFLGGKGQWIGASPERLVKVMKSTLWLCGQKTPSRKKLQIVMGRICFIMQFRRPAMSHFELVWDWISKERDDSPPARKVRRELLVGLCGFPLFHTWLGCRIDHETTCSDASMSGGAVAVARTLSKEGAGFVWSQLPDCQALQIPVVVVSLFNGIGGAFRCYDIAGVRVLGAIACDIHKPANRVTARRWPHVVFCEDIRELHSEFLQEHLDSFGDFKEIHLWAGFPCVDVSSVRANRLNLRGQSSSLIHEALRVLGELREMFPGVRVDFFVENVASMDVEVRDEVSDLLGCEHYRVDPHQQVPNSRPRFCWTSLALPDNDELQIWSRQGYQEVMVNGQWPSPHQWLTPEWYQSDSKVIYSTFMKAIVRKQPPPVPAGLHRADTACRARWQSHAFRYPPYQYRSEFLVFHPNEDHGRLLNADERELLMGYGRGHTLMCMSASMAKTDLQAYEDERCSLIGDSFSIWSFCLFAAAAVEKYTHSFSPRVLFSRMGLPPGASLRLPFSCPLQWGVCFPEAGARASVADLNRVLGSKARHTGSDIRVATGQILNARTFPRQSVESVWWQWEQVFKVHWQQTEHINALEIRAVWLSILWKAMKRNLTNRRIFHLSDSYVALSILSKGRTGSHKLQFICRKIAALLLAAQCQLHLGHVDSFDNPTDEASRS